MHTQPLTREPVEILVLAPESIAKPVGHHLRARRQAASANASSSSALHPSAKVELEEVPEEIATKNVVRVLMWAVEKGLVSVRYRSSCSALPKKLIER